MSKEIEHKFLVKKEFTDFITRMRFDKLGKHRYVGYKQIEQGYLSRKPVVRVRLLGTEAFITVKGKGCRVRDEFEFPIPTHDAKKLLKLCSNRRISKIRHYYGPWEIDVFQGRHRGLVLAEFELKTPKSKLPKLPNWIGKEVTYNPKYSNASLAEK